ncbi:hypothetical protein DU508_11145 [Pedobacter chinensis]|uniref:Uncharacterized protein n=1 Tax=Pedobacter chinensis TaxID=2282421 RepID=A0A369PVK6_9SPHI|nr:hypothetical protein DU508_11145 [Pedobacter chinensis]
MIFTNEAWKDFEYWMDNDEESEKKNQRIIKRD